MNVDSSIVVKSDILEKALDLLRNYVLCDNCLGRQFAYLGTGTDNRQRGAAIKLILTMEAHKMLEDGDVDRAKEILMTLAINGKCDAARGVLSQKFPDCAVENLKCEICGDFFENIENVVNRVLEICRNLDFETFVVGSSVHSSILNREDELRSKHDILFGESIKREINREIGKRIHKKLNKKFESKAPDVVILINLKQDFSVEIDVRTNPLYIFGRYRKNLRGIPQFPVPHSGQYSVKDLIVTPVLEITGGSDAIFHPIGLEGRNVKVLGSGRPFIVEVKNPKIRKIDLTRLEKIINDRSNGAIEVFNLRFSSKEELRRLKAKSRVFVNKYRVLVRAQDCVGEEQLKTLEEFFREIVIQQRTPTRFLGKSKDKTKKKVVYSVKANKITNDTFELLITCQAGLFVREFVEGDYGRTSPSISELLGVGCECLEVDILGVEFEPHS
ncbi:MAG: tRNA pseudouridine(54/55) synthase Pus10 [Candidatus Baldrarchaeia archaeon]